MKKIQVAMAVSILSSCLTLSACNANYKIKVICDDKGRCHVEGSIEGSAGGANVLSGDSAAFDAADVVLDTSGSTVTLPVSGNLTITLSHSVDGSVQAAKQFGWMRTGNTIKIANTSVVNQWATANQASADTLGFDLAKVQVNSAYGEQVLSVAMKYQAQTKASSSTTFLRCSPPGVNSPYPCAQ